MSFIILLLSSVFVQSISLTNNDLFNKLRYYELVQIENKQLNKVDEHSIYPKNGELEFDAFDRHYHLSFRKNTELFHDNFASYHHYNKQKQINASAPTNCYYSAKLIINNYDGTIASNLSTKAAFSACRGQGIRGWIYAFDELIVIRPQKSVMHNIKHNISINDAYIVYNYNDVHRGTITTCGLDHDLHHHTHHTTANHHRRLLRKLRPPNQHLPNSIFTSFNSGIRYVELAIVNDPAMIQHYQNIYGSEHWLTELQSTTIRMINTVQQYYLDTEWGANIGIIHVVLTAIYYVSDWNDYGSQYAPRAMLNYVSSNDQTVYCDSCEPSLFCASCLGRSDYFQIDFSDYLTKFHRFRTSELKQYDNAHLFSYYDFYSTVIGLASLPGMCIPDFSGGIEQTTYDEEYNGNIVAHEMGHNFNMQHDGQGNDCNPEQYIMASVGSPYGFRPESFSTCSIKEINEYFQSWPSVLTCLDNQPQETTFGLCGNGVVEEGETCDCGAADCSMIDKCCDGILCSLYGDAECSNMEDCCHDCKIKNSDSICRQLSDTNTCDIEAEYCDGVSAICPYDKRHLEGTTCSVVNSHYDSISFGYCYYGECVSIEEQCALQGSNTDTAYTLSRNCGWDEIWKTNNCNMHLKCGYTFDELQCNEIGDDLYNVGTPCYDDADEDIPMQCVGGNNVFPQCVESAKLYTYVYITSGWSACSIACRDENSTESGSQTREIACAMQDGTIVDDIICESYDVYKPSNNRTCNDFICDFCAPLVEKPHICHPYGECDSNAGICVCDWGFGGDYCQIEASVHFIGITSHVYLNLSGIYIAERADPCDVIEDFYDFPSKTQTVSIATKTLSHLYIGSVIGIRWNSTGTLSQLSVGMMRVDRDGHIYNDSDILWPFYVGSSLASDNQECQMINASSFDPCFEDLSCNDFHYMLPDDLVPGYYKILVRFNNEHHTESKVFIVECSNHICNAAGYGRCVEDIDIEDSNHICECDDNWSGDRCDESVCKSWIFTSHSCESDVFCANYNKPKCFEGICSPYNDTLDDLCECSVHYNGTYCELPINHCHDITDILRCDSDQACTYDDIFGCVYADCFALDPDECTNKNAFQYNSTWSVYCEWNKNGFCDRVTCDLNDVPLCNNGAVRRPLLDSSSICYAWYCDCDTINTQNDQYWYIPTATTLLSSIGSNYAWNTALNASYVSDIDLFTCAKCGLNCSHHSVANDDCSVCDGCDRDKWEGIECNHLYWIAYFKLNIAYHTVMDHYDAFIATTTQDLVYFFSVPHDCIVVHDVKSMDDGLNVVVYFKYLFDAFVYEDDTQNIGGDVMINARNHLSDALSPAITRGFVTQYTDFTYKLDWCLPTKEVCNHAQNEMDYWELIGYCALFSYLLLAFMIVIWILCRKCYFKWKQSKRYNADKEVREPLSPVKKIKSPSKNYYGSRGSYSEVMQVEGFYDEQDGL